MTDKKRTKRRPKPTPPGAQVPGSARLREIKATNPDLWEKLERLVGQKNLNNHAAGRSQPRKRAPGIYDFHAGIRSWHWQTPTELAESEIAFAVSPPEDAHEPCPEHCGGAE